MIKVRVYYEKLFLKNSEGTGYHDYAADQWLHSNDGTLVVLRKGPAPGQEYHVASYASGAWQFVKYIETDKEVTDHERDPSDS